MEMAEYSFDGRPYRKSSLQDNKNCMSPLVSSSSSLNTADRAKVRTVKSSLKVSNSARRRNRSQTMRTSVPM